MSRMMGGRRYVPAVASHVRLHVKTIALTTLRRIADRAGAGKSGCARSSMLSRAYASNAAAKPICQKIKSHEPVWIFAPRSPVGENPPVKVSACGTTMSALKKYPFARASSGREPAMENWENNRAAVIRSVTNTIASRSGKNIFSAASGMPANGAIVIKATSTTATTVIANQV